MRKESANSLRLETNNDLDPINDTPNDENVMKNGLSKLLINKTKEFIPKSVYESNVNDVHLKNKEISQNIDNSCCSHIQNRNPQTQNFDYDKLCDSNRMEVKMLEQPLINQYDMYVKKSYMSFGNETENSLQIFNNNKILENSKYTSEKITHYDIESIKNENIIKKINQNYNNINNNNYEANINSNSTIKEKDIFILEKESENIKSERLTKMYNSTTPMKNILRNEISLNNINNENKNIGIHNNTTKENKYYSNNLLSKHQHNFLHSYNKKNDLNINVMGKSSDNNLNEQCSDHISNAHSDLVHSPHINNVAKDEIKNPISYSFLDGIVTYDRDILKNPFGLTTFHELSSNNNLNKNEIDLINYNSGNNLDNKPRRYNKHNV